MNSGSERRPFKMLAAPGSSSKLVIARYSNRPRPAQSSVQQTPPQALAWKAVRVGALFAACAFAFFSFSQRNWFQRSGETLGPLPTSVQRLHFGAAVSATSHAAPNQPVSAVAPTPADAKAIDPPVDPPAFNLPDSPNLTVTEFNLSLTPDFQSVGPIDLRLTGINPSAKTYDIKVKTPNREFYRQDVKLAERIPLSRDESEGHDLVVGAISQNRVFGYISEPRHRGHRRHRRRH
jgi:hypothetical protein